MTKKKRIITRLLVVLAALTLISCCFLGSTFARYTSSNSGSASVEVAKWAVNIDAEDTNTSDAETIVDFGKLSPKAEAWASGSERKHSTAPQLVATIKNESAVAAEVTVSAGTIELATVASPAADYNTNLETIKKTFTVTLSYSIDNGTTKTALPASLIIAGKEVAATGSEIAQTATVQIYAQVTWTTQDSVSDGTAGDKIDTLIGQNVTSVKVPVSYTAVQHTQIPA